MKVTHLALVMIGLVGVACGGPGEGDFGSTALTVEVNEALAVSHLRSLVGAQTHAQSLGLVDADDDGVGEFLFLEELTGTGKLRAGGAGRKYPLLHPQSCRVSSSGHLEMHGYLFRVYLPGEDGASVGEGPGEGGLVSADGAEQDWVAYAWPVQHGSTGLRTFVVGVDGAIAGLDVPRNSGSSVPKPFSAFEAAENGTVAFAGGWTRVE